jgi:hypothetical protein
MRSLPRDLSVTLTDLTVHLARSHGSIVEDLQAALAQLSRAESPNEPRLLLGSVVYFFLGAGLAAEACCSFF